MKIIIPVCILCDSEDVSLWTLDNGGQATVTNLCDEHAAPLMAIMDAAGGIPPSQQLHGGQNPRSISQRQRRRQSMEPLLDWTPPSEQKVPGPVTTGDVDLAV